MTPIRAVLVVLCLLGGATGCSAHENDGRRTQPATTATAHAPIVTPFALDGGVWYPERDYLPADDPVPPETGAVRFSAFARWGGYDGCNREGGTYRVAAGVIRMSGGPVTDMGCANVSPSGLLDGTVLTLDDSAARLTATGPDGEVVVEYQRRDAPTADTPVPPVDADVVTLDGGHCWVNPIRWRGRTWFALRKDQLGRTDDLDLGEGQHVEGTITLASNRSAVWIDRLARRVRFRPAGAPGTWPTNGIGCM